MTLCKKPVFCEFSRKNSTKSTRKGKGGPVWKENIFIVQLMTDHHLTTSSPQPVPCIVLNATTFFYNHQNQRRKLCTLHNFRRCIILFSCLSQFSDPEGRWFESSRAKPHVRCVVLGYNKQGRGKLHGLAHIESVCLPRRMVAMITYTNIRKGGFIYDCWTLACTKWIPSHTFPYSRRIFSKITSSAGQNAYRSISPTVIHRMSLCSSFWGTPSRMVA